MPNTVRGISHEQQVASKVDHFAAFAESLGFKPSQKAAGCFDLINVRIWLDPDSEKVTLYAFEGKVGMVLKYQASVSMTAPSRIVLAMMESIVTAERDGSR